MKKIVIGSDKSGFTLKEAIKAHLIEQGYEVEDVGTTDPENPKGYVVTAPLLAKKISSGEYEKGILCCGTGMGMAITANKFPGVYAAVCQTLAQVHYARAINNANVLTMGGWILGPEAGIAMTDEFLKTEFLVGLEDWRQVNLTKAFQTLQETEKELYK
jgi:ribose 5-phosphate isomerase B